MNKNQVICPECKGSRGEMITEHVERTEIITPITFFKPCWYCAGTGFASDDDTFEEFWKRQ